MRKRNIVECEVRERGGKSNKKRFRESYSRNEESNFLIQHVYFATLFAEQFNSADHKRRVLFNESESTAFSANLV